MITFYEANISIYRSTQAKNVCIFIIIIPIMLTQRQLAFLPFSLVVFELFDASPEHVADEFADIQVSEVKPFDEEVMDLV